MLSERRSGGSSPTATVRRHARSVREKDSGEDPPRPFRTARCVLHGYDHKRLARNMQCLLAPGAKRHVQAAGETPAGTRSTTPPPRSPPMRRETRGGPDPRCPARRTPSAPTASPPARHGRARARRRPARAVEAPAPPRGFPAAATGTGHPQTGGPPASVREPSGSERGRGPLRRAHGSRRGHRRPATRRHGAAPGHPLPCRPATSPCRPAARIRHTGLPRSSRQAGRPPPPPSRPCACRGAPLIGTVLPRTPRKRRPGRPGGGPRRLAAALRHDSPHRHRGVFPRAPAPPSRHGSAAPPGHPANIPGLRAAPGAGAPRLTGRKLPP